MSKRDLYCKTEMSYPDRSTMQLVLPEVFRKQVLQGCHDDLGHLGIEQMIDLLRDHSIGQGCSQIQPNTSHIDAMY